MGLLLTVRYFLFKPDGIGDFVLATGAIDLLAREAGEENLVICVRSLLAPLAKAQFPQATIIELPVAEKRKVVNLFALNFIRCLPVWRAQSGISESKKPQMVSRSYQPRPALSVATTKAGESSAPIGLLCGLSAG